MSKATSTTENPILNGSTPRPCFADRVRDADIQGYDVEFLDR